MARFIQLAAAIKSAAAGHSFTVRPPSSGTVAATYPFPQGNGAVPIGLRSNSRPRRSNFLPAIAYWATLGLMAGTAGLSLQLMRDIAARAAPAAPLSREACQEAAKRAPAFKTTRLRTCLAKAWEAGP
jgi:hypothetical protein